MKAARKHTRIAKPPVVSWRPKAKSKQEKERLGLQSHHRAPRTSGKCAVASCRKTCVEESQYCACHRSINVLHVPQHLDFIRYGE